jgi:hypothetical protein
MLRNLALGIGAVVCLSAGAASADMNATFGNTVMSRYADGGWVKHYFSADGAYAAHWSNGKRLTARWTQEGNRVCLTNIRPSMLIPRFCTPLIEASVGDTWAARDPIGRRVQNTLLAGRQ